MSLLPLLEKIHGDGKFKNSYEDPCKSKPITVDRGAPLRLPIRGLQQAIHYERAPEDP